MIKTILVATDDSNHAKKAVSLAADLASRYNARLIILHAMLRDATSNTLRKLAVRRALTAEQRKLLDTYEIDIQMAVAGSGLDGGMMMPVPAPVELLEPIVRQILDRAAAAAKKAKAKKVTTVLSGGDPAETVLRTAKRQKAGLIVIGTRGFGELKSLVLGSVSHKVAQQATRPVLTVK